MLGAALAAAAAVLSGSAHAHGHGGQGGGGGRGRGGGGPNSGGPSYWPQGWDHRNSSLVACVDSFVAAQCSSCTSLTSFMAKAKCVGACVESNLAALEAACFPPVPTWAPHAWDHNSTEAPAAWHGDKNKTHHGRGHGGKHHGRGLGGRNSNAWGGGGQGGQGGFGGGGDGGGSGVPSTWFPNGFTGEVNQTMLACIEGFVSACNCGNTGFFQEAQCLDMCIMPQVATIWAQCFPDAPPLPTLPPAFSDGGRNHTWAPFPWHDGDNGTHAPWPSFGNRTWGHGWHRHQNKSTPRRHKHHGLRRLVAAEEQA